MGDRWGFNPAEKGRRLVATEIEKAHRSDPSGQRREDEPEKGGLLGERRPRSSIEEQELGAKQPDTLRTLLERLQYLGHTGRVGEDADEMAVQCLGRVYHAFDRDRALL